MTASLGGYAPEAGMGGSAGAVGGAGATTAGGSAAASAASEFAPIPETTGTVSPQIFSQEDRKVGGRRADASFASRFTNPLESDANDEVD